MLSNINLTKQIPVIVANTFSMQSQGLRQPDDTLGDLTEPVGSSVMTPLKIMAVSILDAR